MTEIRHISPASAFKVGFLVNGIVGLVGGVACSIAAFAAIGPDLHARMPFMHTFGAMSPIILCPILYGIVGGIGAVIGAALYNLVSGWVGGLEVEIQ